MTLMTKICMITGASYNPARVVHYDQNNTYTLKNREVLEPTLCVFSSINYFGMLAEDVFRSTLNKYELPLIVTHVFVLCTIKEQVHVLILVFLLQAIDP